MFPPIIKFGSNFRFTTFKTGSVGQRKVTALTKHYRKNFCISFACTNLIHSASRGVSGKPMESKFSDA
jgi:hypothetical protein